MPDPESKMLDMFYFIHPVLGYDSYSPDQWTGDKDGFNFDIITQDQDGIINVTVPMTNIAFMVQTQHWLAEGVTPEEHYENERKAAEEAYRKRMQQHADRARRRIDYYSSY
jgi:arginine deiminase